MKVGRSNKQRCAAVVVVTVIYICVTHNRSSPDYHEGYEEIMNIGSHIETVVTRNHCSSENYLAAVSMQADASKLVILSLVDAVYIDMAFNFYETSLRPFRIENFLFVGVGKHVCQRLCVARIPCFVYKDANYSAITGSTYGSKEWNRKVNTKNSMILEALSSGFTVVLSDLDIYFARNPLPHIKDTLRTADVATMWDSVEYNSGFLAVRPSSGGRELYRRINGLVAKSSTRSGDQTMFNRAVETMTGKRRNGSLSLAVLDRRKFLCGKVYFENPRHLNGGKHSCADCVVIHNNWIVSLEAKIYRFRDNMMWMYDKESYYSSRLTRYLQYSNHMVWQTANRSFSEEIAALKAALVIGKILDRIVVLPQFHCISNKYGGPTTNCPLNDLIKIKEFDKFFGNKYRESSFLQHPLVPLSTTRDRSTAHTVDDVMTRDTGNATENENKVLENDDDRTMSTKRLSAYNILTKFGNSPFHVLVFTSLYHVIVDFSTAQDQAKFDDMFAMAVRRSNYRQQL